MASFPLPTRQSRYITGRPCRIAIKTDVASPNVMRC
jgi:hypothetical protein